MSSAHPPAHARPARARRAPGRHRKPSVTKRRLAAGVSVAVPMATAGMTLGAAPAQAETLSPREIAGYAEAYGLPCTEAVAIVLGESSGNTDAHNPRGEDSVGIWQINLNAHAGDISRAGAQDPDTATRYAAQLYRDSGWTAWGAYTNGSYTQFLDEARAACDNPADHAAVTTASGGDHGEDDSGGDDGSGGRTYQIQPGDTLSGIAARMDTTAAELAEINDIANPDLIYAGDTIKIRSGASSGSGGGDRTVPASYKGSGSSSSLGTKAVALAAAQKGDPYAWGAEGPNAFDCSGLVQYVFGKLGHSLPRTAQQQYDAVQHVSRDDLRVGDLVFLAGSSGYIYHVGIYAGDGSWWVARHPGTTVTKQQAYWMNGGYDWRVGRVG